MRTNDLRKLVQSRLKSICSKVYYKVADEDAVYPHIVFNIKSVDLGDLSRHDYSIDIDIWDKDDPYNAEELADKTEDLFDCENIPQDTILPTFFLDNRTTVTDDDKSINHIIIRVIAQNYER